MDSMEKRLEKHRTLRSLAAIQKNVVGSLRKSLPAALLFWLIHAYCSPIDFGHFSCLSEHQALESTRG